MSKRISLLAAAMALIVQLCVASGASAASRFYPLWCSHWDPNPVNTSGKFLSTGTRHRFADGSVAEIDEGYYHGAPYVWANLAHGRRGEQIALYWEDGDPNNLHDYQCGDSRPADVAATVWTAGGDTWTAGVPASGSNPLIGAGYIVWDGGRPYKSFLWG
jgi:hypothetical protein